jgi:hypothetical protein
VRLIRANVPGALIVGPSAAPGPGLAEGDPKGWLPQKEWLFLFLKQASANDTLPDILSWHDYTGQPSMAVSMQAEVREWMQQQGMPYRMPMGYNEMVDSVHSQSAGYHIATAEALGRARADHAVFGCWPEPGSSPSVGTCWDGSLDGLLDPAAADAFSPRPKYWALRWLLELDSMAPDMVVSVNTTDPSAGGYCNARKQQHAPAGSMGRAWAECGLESLERITDDQLPSSAYSYSAYSHDRAADRVRQSRRTVSSRTRAA